MSTEVQYLNDAHAGFEEIKGVAGELKRAIDLGKEQAKTRDGVIETINDMCDALQLACDLIAKELSFTIVEFNRAKEAKEEILRGYFERTAVRYSEPSLRLLLHEGQVCGELHKLGDRFRSPFSPQTVGGVSIWQAVMTFFNRSNSMSRALHGLNEGERHYLRDIAMFLDEVRIQAETANVVPWGEGSQKALQAIGERLVQMLREKRQTMIDNVNKIRRGADEAISRLH